MPQLPRVFNPYEQNQLKKHKITLTKAQKYGKTPVEYITGFAEFGGHDFAVNPNVLIPRVETAQMINIALSTIDNYSKGTNRPLTFADVGTGSGCLGISLFLRLKALGINSKAYLSDVSTNALIIARRNLTSLNNLACLQSFKVIHSNLLSNYPSALKFDLILANLPYIPSLRLPQLPLSVRNYEPLMALDGGINGLQLIRALIRQAPDYLKENGAIILEIDDKHKIADFTKFTNFKKEIKKDCFGRNRFLLLQRLL